MARPTQSRVLLALALIVVAFCVLAGAEGNAKPGAAKQECTASSSDTILGMTQFFGNKNSSDAVWHDELPYFKAHGPISRLTLYRAFFYDGIWHDPGELKGMQFWYGKSYQPPIYEYKDGDSNLIGARKPHLPQEFNLAADEVITKVELQWDPISMRWVAFTTNKGRVLSWGFKDVSGATKAISEAPLPGAYLAAVRALEGKPAPVAKKRYIIQVSLVWALPSCKPAGAASSSLALERSVDAARLAGSSSAQGPSSVYSWDSETVALIPKNVEGSNIIYAGVSIVPPSETVAVPATPAAPEPAPAPVPVPAPVVVEKAAPVKQAPTPVPVPAPVVVEKAAPVKQAPTPVPVPAAAAAGKAPVKAAPTPVPVPVAAAPVPTPVAKPVAAVPATTPAPVAQAESASVPASQQGSWAGLWSVLLG